MPYSLRPIMPTPLDYYAYSHRPIIVMAVLVRTWLFIIAVVLLMMAPRERTMSLGESVSRRKAEVQVRTGLYHV